MSHKHRCHAAGCNRNCAPRLLFCKPHWEQVPDVLKAAVWAHYRPGQEVDKVPSRTYCAVQRLAVAYVAKQEGHEGAAFYLLAARRHLATARERGEPPADLDALFRLVEAP